MLKVASLINRYSSLIVVVLATPVLAIFFSQSFQLQMIPQSPNVRYLLEFEVPARTGDEVFARVTEPTERVLNGLPGLLSLASETVDERLSIQMTFSDEVSPSSAYLNIQEKMDRIRLMLPRDVKSWRLSETETEAAPTMRVDFEQPIARVKLKTVLASVLGGIKKTEPNLDANSKVIVSPDPRRLAQNQVALSQFVAALQSLGLEAAIGRKDGVMFETGMAFESFEELKSAPVAARGHRPIRLSDVAEVRFEGSELVNSLNVWIDPQRLSVKDFKLAVESAGLRVKYQWPFWAEILRQSFQPMALIFLVFLLQLIVIPILRLPWRTLPMFALMGLGLCIHFLFWKGLVGSSLTVIDLHALALTLIVGSVFLAVLCARIRTYFESAEGVERPNKTLDQAKLFSLAELIPTYLVLVIAFWLMSLPLLNTGVNIPARLIAEGFFYFGVPITFGILIVTPLLTPLKFLTENIEQKKPAKSNFAPSPGLLKVAMWGIFVFIFSTILLFNRLDFGLSYQMSANQISTQMLSQLRGYDQSLVFKSKKAIEAKSVSSVDVVGRRALKVREFSPSSLQHLGSLDLGGFASALEKVQLGESFGRLQTESASPVPIVFSGDLLNSQLLGELLLAGKDENTESKPIRVLTTEEITQTFGAIRRDNLVEGDHYYFKEGSHSGTFRPPPIDLRPTPWSAYLISEFKQFKDLHFVSLVFLFFLFAIYLNSFVRSAMLMIFVLASVGFVYMCRELIPSPFHLDSVWLLYLPAFLALFQILVLTRVIDIERTRGIDRDLSLRFVQQSFAPAVFMCSFVIVLAVLLAGVSEQLLFSLSLGFWKEGLFIAVMTAVILVVSQKVLFPLFYLVSEEFVDRIVFRIYSLFQRR